MHTSREYLLEYAFKDGDPKGREAKEKMALHHIYKFTAYVAYFIDDPEAKIKAGERLAELWEVLLDEDEMFYQHRVLCDLYSRMAGAHCSLRNTKQAVECLKKAKRHLELYDAIEPGEHYYSGAYFSSCSFDKSKTARNYEGSELALFKKELESNVSFEPLRTEKEFTDLLASI